MRRRSRPARRCALHAAAPHLLLLLQRRCCWGCVPLLLGLHAAAALRAVAAVVLLRHVLPPLLPSVPEKMIEKKY